MAFKPSLSWIPAAATKGLCSFFGALTLFWPGITLDTLFLVFGGYVVPGWCIHSWPWRWRVKRKAVSIWPLVLGGIASLSAGPELTVLQLSHRGLLYLIGGWAVVRGLIELIEAIRLACN